MAAKKKLQFPPTSSSAPAKRKSPTKKKEGPDAVRMMGYMARRQSATQ